MIRPMERGDLPGVLNVASHGWGRLHAQRSQSDFNEMFGSSAWKPFFYVFEVDIPGDQDVSEKQIAGMAGYGPSWLNYGIYDIFWVGVLPRWRGQGIARKLVSRCMLDLANLADQILLATDIPDFYKRHWGFQVVHALPTTQGPGDVLMAKDTRLFSSLLDPT